jgi:hypothetical protein
MDHLNMHIRQWPRRGPSGRFDGRIGHNVFVRDVRPRSTTPSALLEQGLAQLDDMLTMRHAGMQFTRPCNNVNRSRNDQWLNFVY